MLLSCFEVWEGGVLRAFFDRFQFFRPLNEKVYVLRTILRNAMSLTLKEWLRHRQPQHCHILALASRTKVKLMTRLRLLPGYDIP